MRIRDLLLSVAGGIVVGLALHAAGKGFSSANKGDLSAVADASGGDTVRKTPDEWRKTLTPEQYYVTREKGTEAPFTGKYWNCDKDGVYRCACCGEPLFDSGSKFDAGCGWPSFSEPVAGRQIKTAKDSSMFMDRTEVICRHCGAHLGHVFDDGPGPTGLRYCINSAALKLDERPQPKAAK